MDCQESKNCQPVGCGGCGPSTIKVGKWWWTIRYVPREGNEEFITAMNSMTKEKAEEMGQEGLDNYFKSIKPPKFVEVDFIDQNPEPLHTAEGTFIFYKDGQMYEIKNFISAEKIQTALCTDPNCKDPKCLEYQAEIKAKVASGHLKIVK